MSYKQFPIIILLVAGTLLWSATGVLANCVTANCHAALGKARVVHQPVAAGACKTCHQSSNQPHPGPGSMQLVKESRELCLTCHADPAGLRPSTIRPSEEIRLYPHFPTFIAELQEADLTMLAELTGRLLGEQFVRVDIVGHTDDQEINQKSRGIFADNQALSEARARSVAAFLNEKLPGIGAITTVRGMGETMPLADNLTEAGRALNRRVELYLMTAPVAVPPSPWPFVHPPVADDCTGCHSPHQSANAKLLLQPGGKLCLMCHDSILAGKRVHGPVRAQNCAMCHDSHASANPSLLKRPGNESCLACHPGIKQIVALARSQHEPVTKGRCWECHAPHASDFPPYLRANYPAGLYEPYSREQYALCFNCHNPEAFEFDRTSEATSFRNRDQNLHYFHVTQLGKGRACKVCHGVHGADQPRLIQSRSAHFGKWQIPVYFSQTEAGGTCVAGCHRPKSYDLIRRAVNR